MMKSFKDLQVFKDVEKIDKDIFLFYLDRMIRRYEYAQEQAQLMEENNIPLSKQYWLGVSSGTLCCMRLVQRAIEECFEVPIKD